MSYLTRVLSTAALLCLGMQSSGAADTLDPFNTDASLHTPAGCAALLPGEVLNLPQVVDGALCNNPKTREVWANARYQAAQVGVAKSAYLPSLTGTLAASRSRTEMSGSSVSTDQRSASLGLSWLLYDFGGRAAGLDSAKALLDAANATQDSTVQTVWLAAVQAFYGVQAKQAALDAAKDSEAAAEKSYLAAQARYQAGVATPADSLQAKTAWSQAMLNRISAEGALHTAEGALANVLGLDANKPVRVEPAATSVPRQRMASDMTALIDQVRRERPDLRAAEAQFKSAQANVTVARAAGRPSLSLTANSNGVDTQGSPFTRGNTVGVNLTIPLFSGFSTNYRIRAAEAQADAKSAQLDALRLQVGLDVWNAWQNLTTATQSLTATDDLYASAQQADQVALGRYKAGMGTILDVLNAQSALASARQQKVQAVYNWNISRASLAQAMGQADLLQLAETKVQP